MELVADQVEPGAGFVGQHQRELVASSGEPDDQNSKGFQIALRTEDPWERGAVLGLVLMFFFGVFINAGVVMGLLPTKGLTLPFLSYGGSSLICNCLAFGLILNFERLQRSLPQSRVYG